MLIIQPFKPEHIKYITEGREGVEKKWENVDATALAQQHLLTDDQPAWTAFDDEKVLGCAGIYIIWRGVAQAWVWLNAELTEKHKFWFHRTVKSMLYALIKEHNLRRIQCSVDSTFAMGLKWIESLGFKKEGEMRKYGPNGETWVVYVILREDQ